jgi:hypothetical protein
MIGSIKTTLLGVLFFVGTIVKAQLAPTTLFVGHSDRIKTLDSLINNAESLALNKNDYKQSLEFALKAGIKSDSLITNVAIHFFTHLAYGNHSISLQYEGVRFKPTTFNVTALVNDYVAHRSLNKLAVYLTNTSKEVPSILSLLQVYKDSSKKYSAKIVLLKKAASDYRWLNAIKQENRIILVNIPSAQLRAYDHGKQILNMKVIVGKFATPTNTLSSPVDRITINPYWMVPKSIATKEMLPKIIKDINYLASNHLQLLNSNYKIINPSTINWGNYSEENFPFTIRQGTGCDNSLGLLKVEFDSPFGIYLHDTPEKGLFANTNRFYSHGCMRMEKPIDMGKWLLQNNAKAIDTIDFKQCYKDPSPKSIPVTLSTQIIVWYSLVDFDYNGKLKFYKNIYEK